MDINRKTAYLTLLEIEKNQAYSNLELNRQIEISNPDSPAFVRELVYGVLEQKLYLDYILSQLIPKGLKGIKKQALTLLRMGLYQIMFMDSIPEYAAVNETVKMARKLASGRDGFINGVLRGYLKNRDQLKKPEDEADPVLALSIKYSYAPWIVKLWIEEYGKEKAEELLIAGNERPDLCIRVNLLKTGKDELSEALQGKGFEVKDADGVRSLLVKGSGLLDTEEFANGMFSVQDLSSTLAAETLAPAKGETVYDICAAPGGKTLAMAEIMENQGRIIACDIYEHKLNLLNKEAVRLGISIIETAENDGEIFREDWRESADKVLVDAPCSGLGVIRRKPEIKYKELDDNGRELAEKQLVILTASSAYVKKGGSLVYSTCTINRAENEEVVEKFIENNGDFQLVESRQLFPGRTGTDGFFICRMKRNDS